MHAGLFGVRTPTWVSGQAIIEFVIILPLFLVLAAGAWEYGRILDAQVTLTNAAREGARFAAVHTLDTNLTSEVVARVTADLQSGYGSRMGTGASCSGGDVCFAASDITVTYTPAQGPGSTVSVQASVHVTIFASFVPGLGDPSGKYTISALESMVLQ